MISLPPPKKKKKKRRVEVKEPCYWCNHEYLVSFKVSFLIKNNFNCTLRGILQQINPWNSIS